jgi:hypothetical protein
MRQGRHGGRYSVPEEARRVGGFAAGGGSRAIGESARGAQGNQAGRASANATGHARYPAGPRWRQGKCSTERLVPREVGLATWRSAFELSKEPYLPTTAPSVSMRAGALGRNTKAARGLTA